MERKTIIIIICVLLTPNTLLPLVGYGLVCVPSTQEAGVGRLLRIQSQSGIHGEFRPGLYSKSLS